MILSNGNLNTVCLVCGYESADGYLCLNQDHWPDNSKLSLARVLRMLRLKEGSPQVDDTTSEA